MIGRKITSHRTRRRTFIPALCAVTLTTGAVAGGVTAAHADSMPTGANVSSVADCPGTPTANYNAATDPYSLYNQVRAMGAPAFYSNGFFGQNTSTGKPIDIAVIDSGIAPIAGFDSGNVVDGPDLSFESQAAYATGGGANPDLVHNDTFGHGTHMASIIAGRDDASGSAAGVHSPYSWNDPAKFTGVAPGARLIDMKVADSQGAVDPTQIIAAVDWIVQHRNDAKYGLDIRIINLSYGQRSLDDVNNDALTFALEQAWNAGILVVVSAGNDRDEHTSRQQLLFPAIDNSFLSVGAYDIVTKKSTDWTQKGSSRHPDVLAPGMHVMGLHVRQSAADDEITDDCIDTVQKDKRWSSPVFGANQRFVRGSGTSQAAAMASGAAALLLSKNPNLTPEQVKSMLKSSALTTAGPTSIVGAGRLSLEDAYVKSVPSTNHATTPANGGGFISMSRGTDALPCLSILSVRQHAGEYGYAPDGAGSAQRPAHRMQWYGGLCSDVMNMKTSDTRAAVEVDIRGLPFDAKAHALEEAIDPATRTYLVPKKGKASPHPWVDTPDGEMWNGAVWTGKMFVTDTSGRMLWTNAPWAGNDWLGHRFSAFNWTGHTFRNGQWMSDGLQGMRWRGSSWTGHRWTGHTFRDNSWS